MTGIDLITEQLTKRGSVLADLPNDDNQYAWAAAHLATGTFSRPKDWNKDIWHELCSTASAETRIAIAGALLTISLDKIIKAKGKAPKSIYNNKGG